MVKRIDIDGMIHETPKNREQVLEELLVQLLTNRNICFIPDAGPLLGWEERVKKYVNVE